MRRLSVPVSLLAAALVAWAALGRGAGTAAQDGTPDVGGAQGRGGAAVAQDATPAATAGNPLVGAWRVTVSPPLGPPHQGLVTFAADGTLRVATQPVQPAPPGVPFAAVVFGEGHGVWEPADGGAAFVVDLLGASESGVPFGTLTLRGLATLGPDGQTLSGAYALTITPPDGAAAEAGQGSFQGRRMTVGAPATPTGGTPTAGTPDAATPAP